MQNHEEISSQLLSKSENITLATYTGYVDVENPIWQTQVRPQFIGKSHADKKMLIPMDTILKTQDELNLFNSNYDQVIYQTWVGQFGHNLEELRRYLETGKRLQLWLDKPVEDVQEFLDIYRQLSHYKNFELLYSPRLLFRIEDIFSDELRPHIKRLKVQLHTKKNQFDSWPTTSQLWLGIHWLKKNLPIAEIEFQVFDQDLNEAENHVRQFLESPTPSAYNHFAKYETPIFYFQHAVAKQISRMAGTNWLELIRLFLIWLRQPTKSAWNLFTQRLRHVVVHRFWIFCKCRLWYFLSVRLRQLLKSHVVNPAFNFIYYGVIHGTRDFVWLFLLYPFKKIYWFLRFQYQKRVLKRKQL